MPDFRQRRVAIRRCRPMSVPPRTQGQSGPGSVPGARPRPVSHNKVLLTGVSVQSARADHRRVNTGARSGARRRHPTTVKDARRRAIM